MQIFLTREAQKQYAKLNGINQKKIKKKINALEKDYKLGKKLKGELVGSFSVRAWPYRIIYVINKKELWIVSILHRQGVYK